MIVFFWNKKTFFVHTITKRKIEVIVLFYREKGFYISLACGIVALVAFGIICYSLIGGTGDGDGDTQMVSQATQTPVVTAEPTVAPATQIIEDDEEDQEEAEPTPQKKPTATPKSVETDANPVKNTLHFDEENGLLWPLQGEILMEYSDEQVVYFKTLAQYRTNPAIIIGAKEGDEVKASADGIVTEVSTSDQTGRTVTMDIGDDYSVKYGQLKEVSVQKGDTVTEGQVIGKVAAPTNYYSLEGANLYYQVLQKDQTVNPMLLLR